LDGESATTKWFEGASCLGVKPGALAVHAQCIERVADHRGGDLGKGLNRVKTADGGVQ
jgi:hypothetical protein